jgi:hypothetical protein
MANVEVSIEYPVVENMSAVFAQSSQTLMAVGNQLGAAASLLAATGFGGFIGLAAQLMLLALQGNANAIGGHCNEISGDLRTAIAALQDGDTSGAARFAR